MTGPSLDLDALREKAEKATAGPWMQQAHYSGTVVSLPLDGEAVAEVDSEWDAAYIAEASPDVILAVLALVDEQRERISKLEKALRRLHRAADWLPRGIDDSDEMFFAIAQAEYALAGSPAEKEQP